MLGRFLNCAVDTGALPTLCQFDDLPGPRGVPVFGNLLHIESTRVHQQVEAWCEEFGPIGISGEEPSEQALRRQSLQAPTARVRAV